MSFSRHGIQHDWKDTVCGIRVHVSPGSAETLVRRSGTANHHLIAYSLSNISAKNYQNRLMCIEVSPSQKIVYSINQSLTLLAYLMRRESKLSEFWGNMSAKNYQNRLMCVEVIVCKISVVCLRHSVQNRTHINRLKSTQPLLHSTFTTRLLHPVLPLLFPQFISVRQRLVFLYLQRCNFVVHLLLRPQHKQSLYKTFGRGCQKFAGERTTWADVSL